MDNDRSGAANIGRRVFLGAGLATAGAVLILPNDEAAAVSPVAAAPGRTAATPTTVPPDAQSLVPIPAGRVAAAVRGLDEVIQTVLAESGVPGPAASVVSRGKIVYARGFGVRDIKTGVPVDKDTVFHLASVSKSLSSTVVAGIVGHKRISWSDPIVRHLPTFALSDPYVTRHVSYADLFSHSSGLPDHAGDLLETSGTTGPTCCTPCAWKS